MNPEEHTCGMTVRGAPSCPACLGAAAQRRVDRLAFADRKSHIDLSRLKPYSEDPGRDANGLLIPDEPKKRGRA
jgi:tRNA(Arg) A34 adenosine deaminase TadA